MATDETNYGLYSITLPPIAVAVHSHGGDEEAMKLWLREHLAEYLTAAVYDEAGPENPLSVHIDGIAFGSRPVTVEPAG